MLRNRHPWYETVSPWKARRDGLLQQGDFLPKTPVLLPPQGGNLIQFAKGKSDEIIVIQADYSLIILTQTCDLEQLKSGFVTCCPRYDWEGYLKRLQEERVRHGEKVMAKDAISSLKADLRARRRYGFHLLRSWPAVGLDWQIVELRNVVTLPIDYVKYLVRHDKSRIRLKSPYREDLAQAFAATFTRVALDADIKNTDF